MEQMAQRANIDSLLQKLNSLENELQQLKTNGAAVVHEKAAQAITKACTKIFKKSIQPAVGRINEVLKQATKNDLNQIKSQWGEMFEQRLMKSS